MEKRAIGVTILVLILLSTVLSTTSVKAVNPKIKIGVIGPQGLPQWSPAGMREGAMLARDEVNAAGGINVGGTIYDIEIVEGNEYSVPYPDPANAMAEVERLITVEGADFLIGGFRTEVTGAMIEMAMDYGIPFFIDGASTNELISSTVPVDYARYKYVFRVMPTNSTSNLRVLCAFYQYILQHKLMPDYGEYLWPEAPYPQVRVAVLSEGLSWTLMMHEALTNPLIYPSLLGPYANVTYAGSIPIGTTDLTPWLNDVKVSEARLLIHMFSGAMGVALIAQMGALEVRQKVLPVGINVLAHFGTHWESTYGYCEYETILSVGGTGTPIVPNVTNVFWRNFVGNFSAWPMYTAWGAYDCIYMLAEAFESIGSTDKDSVVAYLENPSFERTSLMSKFKFDAFHDVYSNEYGPYWTEGYARPFVVQWQGGVLEVVWPVDQPYSKNFMPLMPAIISIEDVQPSKIVVGQGFSVFINITVENQGFFPARFGVAAPYKEGDAVPTNPQWEDFWSLGDTYTDGYIDDKDLELIENAWGSEPGEPGWNPDCDLNKDLHIDVQDLNIYAHNYGVDIWAHLGLPPHNGTQRGVKLAPSEQTTLTLLWNTTGVAKGNYTITAAASYSLYTDGWVIVAMVGDITGSDGWPDGKCDIRDIALVALHFGEDVPPAPPNCDVTGPTMGVPDGKIDIRDIATVAIHFGEVDP